MTRHNNFRRFVAWFTIIFGAFATLFLGMLVLWAHVNGGRLTVYIDQFGEAHLELVVFAAICGTVPFGLYAIDKRLQER